MVTGKAECENSKRASALAVQELGCSGGGDGGSRRRSALLCHTPASDPGLHSFLRSPRLPLETSASHPIQEANDSLSQSCSKVRLPRSFLRIPRFLKQPLRGRGLLNLRDHVFLSLPDNLSLSNKYFFFVRQLTDCLLVQESKAGFP